MANMKDVAKRAGVSITTVSHVINKTRYVSDELTECVYKAMAELDYHPNLVAGSLRSGRTRTIGLIIPDITNPFFSEISRKIEDSGFEHGYSVIVCNTDDDFTKEKSYIDVLIAKQVDGIVFISAGDEPENLKKPIESEVPIVVVDRDIKDIHTNVVLVDNLDGGYEATRYLIGLGHKRIGFISGPAGVRGSALRFEGYRKALDEAGLDFDESIIGQGDYRYKGGGDAMQTILQNPPYPTAVFASNDVMALGAVRKIFDHGMKVPEDISVIGFDNIPLSNIAYPSLTTMAQPAREMSAIIMKLLIQDIKYLEQRHRKQGEKPEFQKVILKSKLIERDSCRSI